MCCVVFVVVCCRRRLRSEKEEFQPVAYFQKSTEVVQFVGKADEELCVICMDEYPLLQLQAQPAPATDSLQSPLPRVLYLHLGRPQEPGSLMSDVRVTQLQLITIELRVCRRTSNGDRAAQQCGEPVRHRLVSNQMRSWKHGSVTLLWEEQH